MNVLLYCGHGVRGAGPQRITETLQERSAGSVKLHRVEVLVRADVEKCDVLVIPGGSSVTIFNSLGREMAQLITDQCRMRGMGYVGICAGAYLGMSPPEPRQKNGRKRCNEPYFRLLPVYNRANRLFESKGDVAGELSLSLHGIGVAWGQEIAGTPKSVCMYRNGPLFSQYSLRGSVSVVASVREGFGDCGMKRKMQGRAAIVTGKHGEGRVVLCGPHPEQSPGWDTFCFAMIEWAACKRPSLLPCCTPN